MNLSKYSIVLLSAGVGRRLKTNGKKNPKCLLRIKKKTLIENLLNILKKRKAKKITIIVGYKKKILINYLKKIKKLDLNYVEISKFRKYGHSYSWHCFKKEWVKQKKPMLLFHTDIFFDPLFLDNILKSKKKDIIGTKSQKIKNLKKNSFVVKTNQKNRILSIQRFLINPVLNREILGINKFSKKTTEKIFNFMDKYLLNDKKKLSWEDFIDSFIKKTKTPIYSLKNQNFYWTNINRYQDYLSAKKFKI